MEANDKLAWLDSLIHDEDRQRIHSKVVSSRMRSKPFLLIGTNNTFATDGRWLVWCHAELGCDEIAQDDVGKFMDLSEAAWSLSTTTDELRSLVGPVREDAEGECRTCRGSGECSCSCCDHEHECNHCEGSGVEMETPDPEYREVCGIVVDIVLVASIIAKAPEGPLSLGVISSKPSRLAFRGNGWSAILCDVVREKAGLVKQLYAFASTA